MIQLDQQISGTKAEVYAGMLGQLRAMLDGERDPIANAANTAALLFHLLPDLNWAGFYFLQGEELVLGPFQGKPACVRITVGRGVCGTAARRRETVVVQDVDAFPGHIACDGASRSEIVVPLVAGEKLIGVIDLDSPHLARFDDEDRRGLEAAAAVFIGASELRVLPATCVAETFGTSPRTP
jgi:GAF domain-containing protein